jgi:hypothetical protein
VPPLLAKTIPSFLGGLLVAASAISGCMPSVRSLPGDLGTGGMCRGIGIDAILHGSADADPAVWLIDRETGTRIEALWPHGAKALFDPDLTVVLRDGTVFHREGDLLTGACRVGEDGVGIVPG